ncbi:MAG: 2OG-Fe(II) oxygenase, partial [Albidovulum sp.]
MQHIIDLDRYPLDRPKSAAFIRLVDACKAKLAQDGLFNLPDFLRPAAIALALDEVNPVLQSHAFTHARRHNIYFRKSIEGLDPSHRALREFETENRTICADQLGQAVVVQL